jgi:hypothetical protein
MGTQRSILYYRAITHPDGYIIEVGQYTQLAIDWFNEHS